MPVLRSSVTATVTKLNLYTARMSCISLYMMGGLTVCGCVTVQVDLVCHGKTEVFPDKDGADPYAVSTESSFFPL